MFADGENIVLYNGSIERYGVDLKSVVQNNSTSKSKSKTKAYSYVSSVGGVVQTHKTWDECKARVNGKSGAKFKKSTSPENEEEIIRELSE